MYRMRENQILFHHDCIIKVNHEVFQESDYDDDLVVFLYDEKDQFHEIAKKAYGTNKLYARRNVLKQWFTKLKKINLYFKKFEGDIVENILTKVYNVIKKKQENPIYISDKDSLKYEKALGSDVASVQQVNASTSFYNNVNNDNYLDEFDNLLNDELPFRMHYVSYAPEKVLENKDVKHTIQISGFCNIMAIRNKEEVEFQEEDDR